MIVLQNFKHNVLEGFEVAVIGSGPAGCSAAMTLSTNYGEKICFITGKLIGGQPNNTAYIDNYLGMGKIKGIDFANNIYNHTVDIINECNPSSVIFQDMEASDIEYKDNLFHIYLNDGTTAIAKRVMLATGCKPKMLGLPNEDKLFGYGISTCAVCDGRLTRGRNVAVVGGSYNAVESALFLAESAKAKKVDIIYRGKKLRANHHLIKQAEKCENINILYETTIHEYRFHENELLEDSIILDGVKSSSGNDGEWYDVDYDNIFLCIGYEDNLPFKSLDFKKHNSFLSQIGDLVNENKQIVNANISGITEANRLIYQIKNKLEVDTERLD